MSKSCGGSETNQKTIILRGKLTLKQQTNADRIRTMTDEELAEFIATHIDCFNCPKPRNGCSENDETCTAAWLDWLKQEVTGNE